MCVCACDVPWRACSVTLIASEAMRLCCGSLSKADDMPKWLYSPAETAKSFAEKSPLSSDRRYRCAPMGCSTGPGTALDSGELSVCVCE
jgi:hypothetical protein